MRQDSPRLPCWPWPGAVCRQTVTQASMPALAGIERRACPPWPCGPSGSRTAVRHRWAGLCPHWGDLTAPCLCHDESTHHRLCGPTSAGRAWTGLGLPSTWTQAAASETTAPPMSTSLPCEHDTHLLRTTTMSSSAGPIPPAASDAKTSPGRSNGPSWRCAGTALTMYTACSPVVICANSPTHAYRSDLCLALGHLLRTSIQSLLDAYAVDVQTLIYLYELILVDPIVGGHGNFFDNPCAVPVEPKNMWSDLAHVKVYIFGT